MGGTKNMVIDMLNRDLEIKEELVLQQLLLGTKYSTICSTCIRKGRRNLLKNTLLCFNCNTPFINNSNENRK